MLQTIIDLFNYLFKKTPPVSAPAQTFPVMEVGELRAKLHELVNKKEFAPIKDDKGAATTTYCNFFTQAVCELFGYNKFKGMMANQMFDYMKNNPQEWRELPNISWSYQGNGGVGTNYSHATDLAMNGHLVVFSIVEKEHGHVNVVYPDPCVFSPNFKRPVSIVANVGRDNFIKASSFAFVPANPPTAFLFVGQS